MTVVSSRRDFTLGLALMSFALCGFVWQGHAQIILSHRNSTAIIDPTSQNGMLHWDIQGQNQLAKQWFWYSTGSGAGGPTASIDTISAPSITPGVGSLSGRYVDITYGNAAFNVSVEYLLTGGAVVGANQVGTADLNESITINNTSGAPLAFHFFQFSDFNLGLIPTNDSVQLTTDGSGHFNSASQSDGGVNSLTESVTTANPSASHGEASVSPLTLNKLNGGSPVVLNDNSFAGPGNVTWALEWDMVLDPGGSFILSKDKRLSVQIVPEPAVLSLILPGLLALRYIRRRKD